MYKIIIKFKIDAIPAILNDNHDNDIVYKINQCNKLWSGDSVPAHNLDFGSQIESWIVYVRLTDVC